MTLEVLDKATSFLDSIPFGQQEFRRDEYLVEILWRTWIQQLFLCSLAELIQDSGSVNRNC